MTYVLDLTDLIFDKINACIKIRHKSQHNLELNISSFFLQNFADNIFILNSQKQCLNFCCIFAGNLEVQFRLVSDTVQMLGAAVARFRDFWWRGPRRLTATLALQLAKTLPGEGPY